jgi:hypothetical protein
MKRRARSSAVTIVCTLALVVWAQCQRQEAPRPSVSSPAAGGARAVAEPPPPSEPTPSAADGGADSDGPPASQGTWLDGNIYRFRFDGVRPCPPPGVGAAARIGATVRVMSKMDELLVAPRDFKLEVGGVILESAILQKAPAACAPLLAPKSLRAGKSTDGVVVFDLPPGFNAEHRPVKITYQPTRWGGAKRVEAVLPAGSVP